MDSQLLAMADRVAYRLNAAFADKDQWPYVGDFIAWDGATRYAIEYTGPERVKGVVSWLVEDTGRSLMRLNPRGPEHMPTYGSERNVLLEVKIVAKLWGLGNQRPGGAPPDGEITARDASLVQHTATVAMTGDGGFLYDAALDAGMPSEKLLLACNPDRPPYQGYDQETQDELYIQTTGYRYEARLWPLDADDEPYELNRIYLTHKVDGDPEIGPDLLVERGAPLT